MENELAEAVLECGILLAVVFLAEVAPVGPANILVPFT